MVPLCQAIGRPELPTIRASPQLPARATIRPSLPPSSSDAFAGNDYEYWRKALVDNGITFGVISRPQDVPDDAQAVACGAVVETAIADMPRTLANPIRLGFAEQRLAKPAPALGQHSDEIMGEIGLSGAEIADCRSGALR